MLTKVYYSFVTGSDEYLRILEIVPKEDEDIYDDPLKKSAPHLAELVAVTKDIITYDKRSIKPRKENLSIRVYGG